MRAQLSRVGLTRLRIYFTEAIKPFRIIVIVFGFLDASSAQFEPSLSLCLPVLQLNFAVFDKRAIPLWIIFSPGQTRFFSTRIHFNKVTAIEIPSSSFSFPLSFTSLFLCISSISIGNGSPFGSVRQEAANLNILSDSSEFNRGGIKAIKGMRGQSFPVYLLYTTRFLYVVSTLIVPRRHGFRIYP